MDSISRPLPPLTLRTDNDYAVIVDEGEVLARKTRGFKPTPATSVESCELAITTLAK